CYEYDEIDSETLTQLGKGNRIKLNEETEKESVSNIVKNGLIAYEVMQSGIGDIEVIDITGRVIKQSGVNNIKGINTFSVKELPAGIYFMRTDNTTNKLRKIIKLK
ncbi:MAG: T9SS type A sorting domain-containing protein, partial [bacterium]